jgi:hypothetical protein
METKIREIVALHALGNQIQIIDVDCVQLTCRILVLYQTHMLGWKFL